MTRPCEYGPRSLMRTTVERPLRKLMTRTCVFMCSVRCAAVSAYMSKRSPLAVRWPCCSRPYHDALPSKTALTPARDGGGTSRTVDVDAGTVLAQPDATASAASSASANARLTTGSRKRLLPQLVSGRPAAERGARLVAVPLAEDVAQVGHERERIRVLLGMTVVGAEALGRLGHDGAWIVEPRLVDVLRSRAVAGLALHVDERALLDGGEVDAARLLPAGHVAADAVVVILLVDLDERLPRAGVHGLLPKFDGRLVAFGARGRAHVRRCAGLGDGRRLAARRREVGLANRMRELGQLGGDLGIARDHVAHRHELVRKPIPRRRWRRGGARRKLLPRGRQLVALLDARR